MPSGQCYIRAIVATPRSEGEAERDIGSPCMIGPGLVVVEKFLRRRRRPQVLVQDWLVHYLLVQYWLVHYWLMHYWLVHH